jgi:cytosine/adenosine deaminase-related metal-dependent hydrolase
VTTLLHNAYVVTMDDEGHEHEDGWLLVDDAVIGDVGAGAAPEADERIDLGGALVAPGLVNTHHHLYQTLTRAHAQQADLFTWLKTLYPIWARLDGEAEYAAARTGLAPSPAARRCSTTTTSSRADSRT